MAYFAQFDLDVPCVAMVTASHNDNGWTGVKMGANRPLTFGPDEPIAFDEIETHFADRITVSIHKQLTKAGIVATNRVGHFGRA